MRTGPSTAPAAEARAARSVAHGPLLPILASMKYGEHAAAVALFFGVLIAPGCASAARAEEMVPTEFEVTDRHDKSVVVSADGGKSTSGWGQSEIGSEEFARAVVTALERSMVFKSAVQGQEADYRLQVVLGEVGATKSDPEFTAQVTATWTLTDRAGTKLFDETIAAEGSATIGDAFVGIKRLQIMKERAARANIRLGIERLSRLRL